VGSARVILISMSNTVSASLQTLPHAYRAATVQYYCSVCQQPATYACPGCNRVFCLEHTTFIERCPDCDVRLSQLEHRTIGIAFGVGAVLAAGLLACGVMAALCALLGWVFGWTVIGALWTHHQRWRLDNGPPGPRLLRGATVPIAPDAPNTDPRLERSGGYESHTSAALSDTWRTFWGGG
jgi:hypothetical protein